MKQETYSLNIQGIKQDGTHHGPKTNLFQIHYKTQL